MAKFMLILHEAPETYRRLSAEEREGVIEKFRAWAGGLAAAGKMAGGEKLAEEGGKVVSARRSRVTIVDGPYSETKEVVGGYFLVQAADYAEAVELARDCPHYDLWPH